jgi:hypothetical protein
MSGENEMIGYRWIFLVAPFLRSSLPSFLPSFLPFFARRSQPLTEGLNQTRTSTPLLHESCSLKTALEAYSAYIDASYSDMADSLAFCDGVILPRLATGEVDITEE